MKKLTIMGLVGLTLTLSGCGYKFFVKKADLFSSLDAVKTNVDLARTVGCSAEATTFLNTIYGLADNAITTYAK